MTFDLCVPGYTAELGWLVPLVYEGAVANTNLLAVPVPGAVWFNPLAFNGSQSFDPLVREYADELCWLDPLGYEGARYCFGRAPVEVFEVVYEKESVGSSSLICTFDE